MTKLLAVCGSPVESSSTELILRRLCGQITERLASSEVESKVVNLNELTIKPCQACGEAPEESFCFFEDSMTALYDDITACDCFLFGSPIYFDTVSAQAKLFIDRCNCIRPPDFNNTDPDHLFLKRLPRKRPGGIVLVGGEKTWFEGARRTIAGFFKWIEVQSLGVITYGSPDYNLKGTALNDEGVLRSIDELAASLAAHLKEPDVRP